MHKRDIAVLLVSCLSIYLSLQVWPRCLTLDSFALCADVHGNCGRLAQHEGVVHFEPAWCVLHDANIVHASEAALPAPVIADLNGDGSREVRFACFVHAWLRTDTRQR